MTAPLTDWDAPELNEAAMTKPIDIDNEDEGEADSEEKDEGSDYGDFDSWKKRLKIPKMSMHADEEQAKRR